jgi:hypothetical protein
MGPVWDPYFNPGLVKTRVLWHLEGRYARDGRCVPSK